MFLVNVGCHMCFTLISLLGFGACVVLGMRFAYFRRLRDSYLYCGMIDSVQSCYVDILLCAFVQIRYFSFGFTTFYTLSCFAACAALVSARALTSV